MADRLSMDDQGVARGTSWPTLTEAAARSGYTREALRKRVRRGKLRAIRGNDGVTRIDPADLEDLPPPELSGVDGQGRPGDGAEELARDGLVDLHERAARAEGEATVLREALAVAEQRAAKADADLGRERERVEQLRTEREEAKVKAAAAEGEAKTLREALAEARRPFWHRWLGVPP